MNFQSWIVLLIVALCAAMVVRHLWCRRKEGATGCAHCPLRRHCSKP